VKQEALALIPTTRAEEGCIDYVLHQHTENSALFCFYENWRSKTDLDAHLQKPHLQAFAQKAPDLLAEPLDVQILKIVE
ncbi:MAG: putative quinol monooxygenase, partial [bacterium]|jgi:quinol monooxygenase YgiN|nr:putative quinol monooxygenase [bacterium]